MGKFLQRKPEFCAICGEAKPIVERIRSGLVKFSYCRDCYDGYFKKIEGRVRAQVESAVKSGKKISIEDTTELTKKITAEVEEENMTLDWLETVPAGLELCSPSSELQTIYGKTNFTKEEMIESVKKRDYLGLELIRMNQLYLNSQPVVETQQA